MVVKVPAWLNGPMETRFDNGPLHVANMTLKKPLHVVIVSLDLSLNDDCQMLKY